MGFRGRHDSAELAEVNETLTDLTSQLGTGVFRSGTPQRVKLNQRITGQRPPWQGPGRALVGGAGPVRLGSPSTIAGLALESGVAPSDERRDVARVLLANTS